MKKENNLNRPYLIINLVFAGVIISVILYSLVFSATGVTHPIPSGSQFMAGEASISTGLSRSFSSIVRFDFESARKQNPFGIRIFTFFLLQLLMRLAGLVLSIRAVTWIKRYALADAAATVFFFTVFFSPFLSEITKQF